MTSSRVRRINFIYDSTYWQTVADVARFLEGQELQPNEDFIFKDSGHSLEIDRDAHFQFKESPEWYELLECYEQVGCIYLSSY